MTRDLLGAEIELKRPGEAGTTAPCVISIRGLHQVYQQEFRDYKAVATVWLKTTACNQLGATARIAGW
jgi:hypothetical protein